MRRAKSVIIIERGLWATIAQGIFGAGSGFRVGWRAESHKMSQNMKMIVGAKLKKVMCERFH